MKTASAKAKARRLQNAVADMIRAYLVGCDYEDVKPATMGEQGVDVQLSPKAKEQFPFSVECKAQERLNIWQALKQAESHGESPVLFFTRNRSETYVAMKAEDFFKVV